MTSQNTLPWVALLATILIWAGYLVVVRMGVTTSLSANDMGLMRSLPAAILLLPVTFRRGLFPGNAGWRDVLFVGGFGGTFFTLLLASGLSFAPVADSGIFTPSMLPLFVGLLAIVFLKTRYSTLQIAGFGLIAFGAIAVGGNEAVRNGLDGPWRGHLLFLAASFCWAIYTVRYRATGMAAIDGAILLVTWSAIFFGIGAMVFGTELHNLPFRIVALQLIWGTLAGLVANFTYLFAIKNLGHEAPAAGAALVPVLAAIGGLLFLGEPISSLKWLGIAIVAIGVVLAAGILNRKRVV